MGGLSAEREVSLDTGRGVLAALKEHGHDAVAIDWDDAKALPGQLADAGITAVWNALHGTYGEDGAVQGLLQCLGILCTGSGVLASALAMDKVASKRIFESHDLLTPRWAIVEGDEVTGFDVPMVIKPANEGSSVGVTIVTDVAQIPAALELAHGLHGPTIVEDFIAGAEVQVGILDGEILGSIEVRPAVEFYDYDAKYKRDDTEYLCPPTLDASVVSATEKLAKESYDALGCAGHGRVDLRVNDAGIPYVLEVNTLPGMTSHSLLPKIAAHAGMSYAQLCERILALAI
jgi:D-alanine-D-alanine ligase